MEQSRSFRYIASQADFRSARRLLFKRSRSLQLTLFFLAVILVQAIHDWLGGSAPALTLLVLTGILTWQFIRSYCLVPSQLAPKSESFIGNEWNFAYSTDGLRFSSPDLDSIMRWTNITKVMENSSLYYLAGKAGRFYIVPKRIFVSPDDEQDFRSTLRRCAPDALG
jgi:hypothetical protein